MPALSGRGLASLGWDEGWAVALAGLGDPALLPARVSRVDRALCTVMTGTAVVRVATERTAEVAVGDWVAVGPGPAIDDRPQIVGLLPRRGVFRRAADGRPAGGQVVAANVDTVLLCDAVDRSLSLRHLERYLALAWQSGATPVVLITKSDAAPAAVVAEAATAIEAVADGVSVVVVSATRGEGLGALAPFLVPGRTVALLGMSGAGKSTLVNRLAGADVLATGPVRRDGKGRHTTTHRQLVLLPGGGLLIDTPGMRALSVVGAGEGVERAFSDLEVLAEGCRYADCAHGGEHGCALTAALADGHLTSRRLQSWLRLRAESPATDYAAARRLVEDRKRRKATKAAGRRTARP